MKKPFDFKFTTTSLLIIIIIFSSFKSNDSNTILKRNPNITFNKILNNFHPDLLLSDTLDVLWIEASEFLKLKDKTKKKITFRFFITKQDSLTLRGWVNKKGSSKYDSLSRPEMNLYNGKKSLIRIGDGTYLGNTVLYNKGIRNIIKVIKEENARYVVFVPTVKTDYPGQIFYDISVSNIEPHRNNKEKLVLVPTYVSTNPSPPRNAN